VSGTPPNTKRRSGYGLLLLAIGRRAGFGYFGADKEAYLASLAPLLAFTLVPCALVALAGAPRFGASLGLMTLCQILAPAVIADWLCSRWDCRDRWPLYANILNWTPLLAFIVLAPALVLARVLLLLGLPQKVVADVAMLAVSLYGLWFQWRLARGALEISRWRAAQLLGATLLFGVLVVTIQGVFGPDLDSLNLPSK
jgi:hypothetical protein